MSKRNVALAINGKKSDTILHVGQPFLHSSGKRHIGDVAVGRIEPLVIRPKPMDNIVTEEGTRAWDGYYSPLVKKVMT